MFNIANILKETSKKNPNKMAVISPKKDKDNACECSFLTFKQLDKLSDSLAFGLEAIGFKKYTRTILFVKPSKELFIIVSALFKIGAVPVLVDPGMGIKRMLTCLEESNPEAFIGVPLAHILRVFNKKKFKTVKTWVTVGRRYFWGGEKLSNLYIHKNEEFEIAKTKEDDIAAILFTTGSTGAAKGAIYTHLNFKAQIDSIQNYFNFAENEIDLPTFPLFALFDPAIGMTAVIPDMDPTKPAKANPKKLLKTIEDYGITNMFASPALLNVLGSYAKENNFKLKTIKRVCSAGAPVYPKNLEQFNHCLNDNALIYTPYGATEALPVSVIDSNEILNETSEHTKEGYGICIGKPNPNIELFLIKITDEKIEEFSDDLIVKEAELGEIIVSGDLVTKSYFNNDKANNLLKIYDESKVWHRMGDLAWMDAKGRLWFCGRKSHRVISNNEVFYTIPCESIFNQYPKVFRTALVGIGKKGNETPVICVELKESVSFFKEKQIKKELLELGATHSFTRNIKHILFHNSFPVDIRHNSKIFREKLSDWASKKINN